MNMKSTQEKLQFQAATVLAILAEMVIEMFKGYCWNLKKSQIATDRNVCIFKHVWIKLRQLQEKCCEIWHVKISLAK